MLAIFFRSSIEVIPFLRREILGDDVDVLIDCSRLLQQLEAGRQHGRQRLLNLFGRGRRGVLSKLSSRLPVYSGTAEIDPSCKALM